MKKTIGFIVILAILCAIMSVSVSAQTVVKEWSGDELLGRPGDAGKEGQVRTLRYGVSVSNHPLWGVETDPIDAKNKTFTIVVEAKIAADDKSTPDDAIVFRIDPKIRAVDATGNIVEEPADQPTPITAKMVRSATKDANGFAKFYYLLTPEIYNNNDRIKIENRINYFGNIDEANENRIDMDIRKIAVYNGNIVPQGNNGGTDGGDNTEEPNNQTGDSNEILYALFGIILTTGCASYLLKTKKKAN